MSETMLTDYQVRLLAECPRSIATPKARRPSRHDLALMKEMKALWVARYISGTVDPGGQVLRFTLTDKGRQALTEARTRNAFGPRSGR